MNDAVPSAQIDLKTVHEHSKHFNSSEQDNVERGRKYM